MTLVGNWDENQGDWVWGNDTPADYLISTMSVPWYAVPDTTIGGWSVSTVDLPTHLQLGIEVASFVCKDAARHIAALHNQWLTDVAKLSGDINGHVSHPERSESEAPTTA